MKILPFKNKKSWKVQKRSKLLRLMMIDKIIDDLFISLFIPNKDWFKIYKLKKNKIRKRKRDIKEIESLAFRDFFRRVNIISDSIITLLNFRYDL